MATWTLDEQLASEIAFALKKVTIPGFRKALKEEDRFAIGATIVEHLKLARWEFSKPGESAAVRGARKEKGRYARPLSATSDFGGAM